MILLNFGSCPFSQNFVSNHWPFSHIRYQKFHIHLRFYHYFIRHLWLFYTHIWSIQIRCYSEAVTQRCRTDPAPGTAQRSLCRVKETMLLNTPLCCRAVIFPRGATHRLCERGLIHYYDRRPCFFIMAREKPNPPLRSTVADNIYSNSHYSRVSLVFLSNCLLDFFF